MKKLFLFVLFLSFFATIYAQNCCLKPGADWHLLALNEDFKASHLAPLPLEYEPAATSSEIEFGTTDGKNGLAFYVPSDEPTNKVLIICHEWWGLNDYIKREAERWQKMLGNVDVYAVDLYDGKVATTPEAAGALMNKLDQKRGERILSGLLAKIGKDKMIATLGWCMGGSWSFTAALLAGQRTAGCVMYYGFPEKDDKKIRTLQADVLYIWGSQDNYITKDVVAAFGRKVVATGHSFELHTFPAVHAFANPSNPKHDAKSAAEAETISLAFLKTKLQLD
jgi:carboxymethylenebutenolidase